MVVRRRVSSLLAMDYCIRRHHGAEAVPNERTVVRAACAWRDWRGQTEGINNKYLKLNKLNNIILIKQLYI